jgi:hypothetical protein
VSKNRTDIYQTTLDSLKAVDKLEETFQGNMQDFIAYIRDPVNIEVNLEKKRISVVDYLRRNKIKI